MLQGMKLERSSAGGVKGVTLFILWTEHEVIVANVNSLSISLRVVDVKPEEKREFGFQDQLTPARGFQPQSLARPFTLPP
jgi:hypothetical protein